MVFLCKQHSKDSAMHVAIKFIPKQTIFDYQNAFRMQQVSNVVGSKIIFLVYPKLTNDVYICPQEITVLQQCDHPFIIHCYGGYEVSKRTFRCMLPIL